MLTVIPIVKWIIRLQLEINDWLDLTKVKIYLLIILLINQSSKRSYSLRSCSWQKSFGVAKRKSSNYSKNNKISKWNGRRTEGMGANDTTRK